MTNVVECKAIPLDRIEIDPAVQPREHFDPKVVEEYAEKMSHGSKFPDPTVFESDGHWLLADGHYRLEAMRRLNPPPEIVDCSVREGGKRAATLWAASANTDHGVRRTNADKRRAVLQLLNDEEWSSWSDREIADHCGVSHTFVSLFRNELSTVDSSKQSVKRKGKDGKVRKSPTKKLKRKQQEKATQAVATTPTGESCPTGVDHERSEHGDCRECLDPEIAAATETTRTRGELARELQAAITPLIAHWPSRADCARVLRDIADNIETASIERDEVLV
ncbi:MAG TPA: hypothetical protein VGN12_29405 [Pirellulales bacterium]|jgi:hypothetical protein